MYKKITKQKGLILLLFISVIFLILRLWRLGELFHFTYDESVFAFIGKRMFINQHIPLIGGVTPFHVHLGPYFYWFSGLLLFSTQFSPLGWGVYAAFISLITLAVISFFCYQVFSKRVAFLAAVIYTFSVLINIYDRHYWGLLFNPLISILVLYSLYKIINHNKKYLILLSLVVSFAFHTDPSTLVLFPLIVFGFVKYKVSWKNRYFLISFSIFLLSFLPLLIFDLRHDLVNIKGLLQYVSEAKESSALSSKRIFAALMPIPELLSRIILLPNNIDLAKEYSYCQGYINEKSQKVPIGLSIITIIILLCGISIKTKNKNEKIVKDLFNFLLLSVFVGIIFYKGILGRPFFEHYLTTLIPILVILAALFIDKIFNYNVILGSLIVITIITVNIARLSSLHHSYGFNIKSAAIKWSIENTSSEFALESLSKCFKYNGYRYLFYLYGKEPVKSYVDENFFYLYDLLPSKDHPKEVVVMVASDYLEDENLKKMYNLYKERQIKTKKFGELEVIIADNTKGILYDF